MVYIAKNKNNIWEIKGSRRRWNPYHKATIVKYLNCLDPLFEKAKEASEFEFASTLLRVQGIQSAGWDPWENTIDVFDNMYKLANRVRNYKKQTHLALWLYGHIVEASEPYNIAANLMRIIDGGRYRMNNFPEVTGRNNYSRPQSPSEKITTLTELSKKINMPDTAFPFQDVFDRNLRNAIFHSDYTLYGSEIRLPSAQLSDKRIYSHDEANMLFNKALAYLEAFKHFMSMHISSYRTPKVISVHPDFSRDPQEKAVTIIRKGYGLVGIKDNWTREQIKQGHISFRMGRYLRYEGKMLEEDPILAILPPNRIKRINMFLKIIPEFLRKKVVPLIEKTRWV